MSIDWFPGHMVAARKAAAKTLRTCDIVIEVLDARVPLASRNPVIEALRRQAHRPALKVLNKADLADRERTREWLAYYNAQPETRAIALSAKASSEVARITAECQRLLPGIGTRQKPLRMMILGIPNVGKSTLVNALLGRAVAKVGNEPGITRTESRHEIRPGLSLVDTAGMLWPRVNDDAALKLAAAHSIGINAYDEETVALALGERLLGRYRPLVERRFGPVDEGLDASGLLRHIAARRSFVQKGGAPDTHRAALALLTDFRDGTLGAITLEEVPEAGP